MEIINKVSTNGIITDGGTISTLGILARTTVIDSEIQKLLSQAPNAVIINLGAGLDTRISRLDNGSLRWYDLDFAEGLLMYFTEAEVQQQLELLITHFLGEGRICFLMWFTVFLLTKKSAAPFIGGLTKPQI